MSGLIVWLRVKVTLPQALTLNPTGYLPLTLPLSQIGLGSTRGEHLHSVQLGLGLGLGLGLLGFDSGGTCTLSAMLDREIWVEI